MQPLPATSLTFAASATLSCVLAGCKHTIAVEPIEVKPIHLTLDINLKVDRELDEFFAFEDQATPATKPATQPATSTAPASFAEPFEAGGAR